MLNELGQELHHGRDAVLLPRFARDIHVVSAGLLECKPNELSATLDGGPIVETILHSTAPAPLPDWRDCQRRDERLSLYRLELNEQRALPRPGLAPPIHRPPLPASRRHHVEALQHRLPADQ